MEDDAYDVSNSTLFVELSIENSSAAGYRNV